MFPASFPVADDACMAVCRSSSFQGEMYNHAIAHIETGGRSLWANMKSTIDYNQASKDYSPPNIGTVQVQNPCERLCLQESSFHQAKVPRQTEATMTLPQRI